MLSKTQEIFEKNQKAPNSFNLRIKASISTLKQQLAHRSARKHKNAQTIVQKQ